MIEILINLLDSSDDFGFWTIRNDSEDSVQKVKSSEPPTVVDIGTGSGALAITAKLELPNTKVIAIDIDKKCLVVAQKNAKKLSADIKLMHGNLLGPLPPSIFRLPSTMLCNLPYVPDKYKLNPSARFEPRLAIFGGKDGLDVYRQLFEQITKLKSKPGYVFTESLPFQHNKLETIAKLAGYRQILSQDLIQVFTYV
jgi:release factor glutamine methyltransferase